MGGVRYVHAHHEWDGNICHVTGGNIRTSAVGGMIVSAGYHVGVGYPYLCVMWICHVGEMGVFVPMHSVRGGST